MTPCSNPTLHDDLSRLVLLTERCANNRLAAELTSQGSNLETLWLSRVINVFTTIAHATRTEYLQADLPNKPIAGTNFRTVPVTIHLALAEGREGVLGLIGEGPFVFTTLTTSFQTFVTEDYAIDPTFPRTLQFARVLTDLRRRAARQRVLQEMQVS